MLYQYPSTTIWNELSKLQQEVEQLLGQINPSRVYSPQYPAINLWANEDSAFLTAELPGFNIDDIDVNVLDNTITISGERKPEELPEGTKTHRKEIQYGKFSRAIQLPYRIDTNKVKATYKNGVLEVTLPRIEDDKPRKINIKKR